MKFNIMEETLSNIEGNQNSNPKTDKYAKFAFCKYLEKEGYTDVKIVDTPVDILAKKGDEMWWFEIKSTSKKKYFGATTLTELKKALDCAGNSKENFRFVIAKKDNNQENLFDFIILTLAEFELTSLFHATIPPFKVYFNVKLDELCSRDTHIGKHQPNKQFDFVDKEYKQFRKLTPDERQLIDTYKEESITFSEEDIKKLNVFINKLREEKIKTISAYIENDMPFYHITPMKNLDAILNSGLKAKTTWGICVVRSDNLSVWNYIIQTQLAGTIDPFAPNAEELFRNQEDVTEQKFAVIKILPSKHNIRVEDVSPDNVQELTAPLHNYIAKSRIPIDRTDIVAQEVSVTNDNIVPKELIVSLSGYTRKDPRNVIL